MPNIQSLINDLSWNEKLAVLRTLKKWSQEKAASECGTTKKNYWFWETGKNYPRPISRRSIARAYGVSEEEIFGGSH